MVKNRDKLNHTPPDEETTSSLWRRFWRNILRQGRGNRSRIPSPLNRPKFGGRAGTRSPKRSSNPLGPPEEERSPLAKA
jgi:hypothetical protein